MPDSVIAGAMERFKHSQSGSAHIRDAALEDIAFARLGEQWPSEIMQQRRLDGRPCLTVNRQPSFIRQVVNDARQNKPAITVHPVDNGADYDTAQVIGGLVRSIERASNAGVAYDTAVEHAVTGGFGFFRISMDYCHEESFDMEARIERVANQFGVHWDTNSTAFDASDWEYAFVSDLLTDDDFKRKYPKANPISFESGAGDDDAAGWCDGDKVRIAEYWLRVEKKRKIVLLSDGRVIREDQLKAPQEIIPGVMLPAADALAMAGVVPVREREASYFEVKRRVINAVEVLSEEDWPGSMIPICPVWGEEVILHSKRHFRSLIRDAKDPQRMLNFWRSASTELVALAPRAPWVAPVGSIPTDQRQKWETANTRSHAVLEYNAQAGVPQRQPFAGVPAGALQEALSADGDMKAVIGIYDAALGARSNETSGRAILARQRESDVATFHFVDNMARAIEYAGRVLIEIIPSIYSGRQAVQILGEDQAPKIARLTQEVGVPPSPDDPNGRLYNIGVGKYDVTVKVGLSYATQREEARETLMELSRIAPQAALVLGDLILANMDFPQADEAARRVKMLQQLTLQNMMPQQPPGAAPGAPGGAGPALTPAEMAG